MASIFIDIASQFTGDKAFKKADSATDKLSKNVKNLGKALGVTLSVGAILAFGKAAVKAAAEDEKAQKQLALALKNVGLGRDVAASEEFINKLSTEFGIVDDQLRPAYQTLAVATRDSAQAQKLLQISLDISASTGKDLSSVTGALSKAFLGNNTALGKLGVGISKADLKAGKFDDIMNQLAKTFKGAASQSADTFSGKMARLTVSIDNAKEILGKGLIDSFMILTDSQGIDELQTKIEQFATSASENMKKLAGIFKENETLIKSILAILAATYVSTKILTGVAATITAIKTLNEAYKVLRATALATAIAEMFALNPYGAAFMVAGMVALIGLTIKGVDALTEAWNNADAAKNYALDPKKYDNAALGVTVAADGTDTAPYTSVYREVSQYNSASNLIQTAGAVTFADLNDALSLIEQSAYFDPSKTGFIIHPSFLGTLRGLVDNNNRPILQDPLGSRGSTLFGYPVTVSAGAKTSTAATATPSGNNLLIVGNTDLMVNGVRAGIESMVSKDAKFDTDGVLLKVRARRAFAVAKPEGFAIIEKTSA